MPDLTVADLIRVMQRRMLAASTYAGVPAVKSPLDAWVYQEIVFERRPEVIIEIGNWAGGALLMYAHWLDALGMGRVIGVDVDHSRIAAQVRRHPRITLLTADAVAAAPFVAALVPKFSTEVLVIEDSSHEAQQCLAVLEAYERLVRPGGYFIVEDTICHHGLAEGPQPGPYEAVQAFLAGHPEWEAERSREAFGLTWNPSGYLRRRVGTGSH